MQKGAQFSPDRIYRYALWRTWDEDKGLLLVIGLNPSTADENVDDPTIRRCVDFAHRWGFGGLYMLNLFAFRATDPKELLDTPDPVGPENDEFLRMYSRSAGDVMAAWGTHGVWFTRGARVCELLGKESLFVLGLTQNGQPRHPLYMPRVTRPQLWIPE